MAAFAQVKKLCEMDQRWVLDRVQPVLEHNYELITSTDWTTYATSKIQDIINIS